ITTAEATITTATVEVKTITINKKQMTLSVFRQLHQEPVINEETGTFNGLPWGTVNYFWGDCQPDHLHVVWQKGSELRRDCVWAYGGQSEQHAQKRRASHAMALIASTCVLLAVHQQTLTRLPTEPYRIDFPEGSCWTGLEWNDPRLKDAVQ